MKKSIRAKLAAYYLRVKFKRPRSACTQKLLQQFQEQKAHGEQPYVLPKHIKFCSNVTKITHDGMDCYILCGNEPSRKTVFYFNGSGYVHGPMKYHWTFCDRLVRQCNVKVIFPVYPLAPFHDYKDMYAAITSLYVDYVDAHPDEQIVFMGDSAGGGFALAFYEYAIQRKLHLPVQTIALSPWVNIATDNPDIAAISRRDPMLVQNCAQLWAQLWANGDDMSNYMLSPLLFDGMDKLSDVHIIVGTDDILYPDILLFYEKIKNNPNCTLTVGERMNHDYPLYPQIVPEAKKAFAHIVSLLGA